MDLNNSITPSAVVTDICADGFDVNLGGLRNIKLKWAVVENCWKEFCQAGIWITEGRAYWFDGIDDALKAYKDSLVK